MRPATEVLDASLTRASNEKVAGTQYMQGRVPARARVVGVITLDALENPQKRMTPSATQ